MAGYTRQDTTGQIANGEAIDADDINAEFIAVQTAFTGASGHNHDPSLSDSGAPIEKVGPAGQVTVNSTQVLPNGDNTIDLGGSASSARFKNGRFGSTVSAATLDGDTVVAGSSGYMTLTDNELDVSSGDLLVDVAGDMTVDVAGGNILLKDAGVDFGSLNNVSGNMTIKSGTTDALQFTGANADFQGTLDVTDDATLDSDLTVEGNVSFSNATDNGSFTVTPPSTFTGTVTGNGGFSGLLTGNVKGDVVATDGTVVLQNGTDGSDAALTGTVSSLSNHDTDDLSEGSTNLYYTSTRADTAAKGAISVTDDGGDGSLAYDSSTGVITYTGPSATDTRAHFSGGTGVSITDGEVAIGQAVGTSDNVQFNNATISGNLTVSGTTTTVNSETINLADNKILLNSNATGTPTSTQDVGIEVERGNATNKSFIWDESADKWSIGSETFVAGTVQADLTGDVTGTVSDVSNHDTDDISEGSSNLYHTTARARSAISASGGISYNSSTGVISTDSSGTVDTSTLQLTGGAQNWSFEVQTSSNILVVRYNENGLFRIDTNGNVTAKGDITAFGNF